MYKEYDEYTHREFVLTGPVEKIFSRSVIDIVPTKEFGEIIFMDNELQLAKNDEYIYHEMLVHPVMSMYKEAVSVCILGGGDGCAAREVLTWRNVQSIDIYDWDEGIVHLFQTKFRQWNRDSLHSSKINIYYEDVLKIENKKYDVIIVDLVDPNYKNLFSRELWENLIMKLPSMMHSKTSVVINGGGFFPWDTKNIEWQLFLLSNAFQENETHSFQTYKVYVPSFDKEWCLFLIKPTDNEVQISILDKDRNLRYAGSEGWLLATTWARDVSHMLPTKPTKLKNYLPPL